MCAMLRPQLLWLQKTPPSTEYIRGYPLRLVRNRGGQSHPGAELSGRRHCQATERAMELVQCTDVKVDELRTTRDAVDACSGNKYTCRSLAVQSSRDQDKRRRLEASWERGQALVG